MVSKVTKGSVLSNNDARAEGATVVVEAVAFKVPNDPTSGIDYVTYHTGQRRAKISGHRIFEDGKSRAQGYNFLR